MLKKTSIRKIDWNSKMDQTYMCVFIFKCIKQYIFKHIKIN